MSMIKLSNGVELSEDTVVFALKKAGIETNPPELKHVFEAGDVANHINYKGGASCWRFIIKINSKLRSVDADGYVLSSTDGQDYFERNGYKFIGKQKDLLK